MGVSQCTAPETAVGDGVPPGLRAVVLLARMRELCPVGEVAAMLGLDPLSREWGALCNALDDYDRAEQAGGDIDLARTIVSSAASAVLR